MGYTAADVIQLPRLTASGAMALGEKILTAAKPHKKEMTKGIAKVLGMVATHHESLKEALRDQVSPAGSSADPKVVERDRTLDACWSGLHTWLTGFTKLPGVAQAAEAGEIKTALFPDGLKFIQLRYDLEWAESETRVHRIKAQGLDKRIAKLGGQLFLDTLFAAHAEYGRALGMTEVQAVGAVPPSLREAMDQFAETLRKYVAKVIGSVDDDDPASQSLADALLEPLASWSVAPAGGGKSSSQEEEPAAPTPGGGGAPPGGTP